MKNRQSEKLRIGDFIKYWDTKGHMSLGYIDTVYSPSDRPQALKYFIKGSECVWIKENQIIARFGKSA